MTSTVAASSRSASVRVGAVSARTAPWLEGGSGTASCEGGGASNSRGEIGRAWPPGARASPGPGGSSSPWIVQALPSSSSSSARRRSSRV